MKLIHDPNLVLYLPFYKLDGNSMMSQDSHGHLCTVTGALWTPNGRSFDGVDDIITVPDSAPLDVTGDLTIAVWMNIAGFPGVDHQGRILVKREGLGGNWKTPYHMSLENWGGSVSLATYVHDTSGTLIGMSKSIDATRLGIWHHVSMTYSSDGYVRRSINGIYDGISASAGDGGIRTSDDNLIVGAWSAGNSVFHGKIGEVIILKRALAAPEIQNIYLATKRRYQ